MNESVIGLLHSIQFNIFFLVGVWKVLDVGHSLIRQLLDQMQELEITQREAKQLKGAPKE